MVSCAASPPPRRSPPRRSTRRMSSASTRSSARWNPESARTSSSWITAEFGMVPYRPGHNPVAAVFVGGDPSRPRRAGRRQLDLTDERSRRGPARSPPARSVRISRSSIEVRDALADGGEPRPRADARHAAAPGSRAPCAAANASNATTASAFATQAARVAGRGHAHRHVVLLAGAATGSSRRAAGMGQRLRLADQGRRRVLHEHEARVHPALLDQERRQSVGVRGVDQPVEAPLGDRRQRHRRRGQARPGRSPRAGRGSSRPTGPRRSRG